MQPDVSVNSVTATAVSGGLSILTFFAAASIQNKSNVDKAVASRLPITLNASGTTPITLAVVASGIGGTSDVQAALNWRELR